MTKPDTLAETRRKLQTGETNGAEDIDELFADCHSIHIEKMSNNSYFIGIEGANGKSATLFIGHWPKGKNSNANLKINITENDLAKWSY